MGVSTSIRPKDLIKTLPPFMQGEILPGATIVMLVLRREDGSEERVDLRDVTHIDLFPGIIRTQGGE
jgi:hypothetical protein